MKLSSTKKTKFAISWGRFSIPNYPSPNSNSWKFRKSYPLCFTIPKLTLHGDIMKLKAFVCLFSIMASSAFGVTFVSSSGQETYKTDTIFSPENNQKLKEILESSYSALKEGDRTRFPLALGAGGYYIKDHWQGLSFGAHAYGKDGQGYLSTRHLKKSKLVGDDFILDANKKFALVRVKGGNTQGSVLDMANAALDPDTRKNYEFFMTGPSSEFITVGGALAAHTHYRSTYPYAGYFLDQVENFTVMAIQDGKATEIFCSRDVNADLFHALPGSFGRGGVFTDITLKLQLVPKNFRPTTHLRKYPNINAFIRTFSEEVEKIKDADRLNAHNRNFLGVNGFMSDNMYYVFDFNFQHESVVKEAPDFDIFKKPSVLTFLGHFGSHSMHSLANFVTEFYALRFQEKTFKNDLRPWLFFHNGYLEFWKIYNDLRKPIKIPQEIIARLLGLPFSEEVFGRDMQTAHQAYVMKFSRFEEFMKTFKKLLKKPEFKDMSFKFRDFVPMPPTKTLMSPAYSENPNDLFVIATFSWPVNTGEEKEQIDAFKKVITALDYVRVHPHKEFEYESDLLRKSFYEQAQMLEAILAKHNIDDRVIWTKMHKALYGKE